MTIEVFQEKSNYARQYYLKNREHLLSYGKQRYRLHRETILAKDRERYYRDIDITRDERRVQVAKWRVINRERHLANERERYQKVKEYRRLWRIKNRFEVKLEVFTHYGNNKCACVKCGESRLACLSIDHINGGGNKDRGKRLGHDFYSYLRKCNYPLGFQTLCMNCQFVKKVENSELRRKE